jgi:hypothetical protein
MESVDSDLGLCARCREPRDAAVHAYECGGSIPCNHSHHAFEEAPAANLDAETLAKVNAVLPCWCDAAFKARKLAQPDCPRCNFAADVVDLLATAEREARDLGTHLSHCNFGENVNGCKYGIDTCPALTEDWMWLGRELQELQQRVRDLEAALAKEGGEGECY